MLARCEANYETIREWTVRTYGVDALDDAQQQQQQLRRYVGPVYPEWLKGPQGIQSATAAVQKDICSNPANRSDVEFCIEMGHTCQSNEDRAGGTDALEGRVCFVAPNLEAACAQRVTGAPADRRRHHRRAARVAARAPRKPGDACEPERPAGCAHERRVGQRVGGVGGSRESLR